MSNLQELLEKWWNEDPESRWIEISCGMDLRVCVRFYEIDFGSETGERLMANVEAGTLEEAIVSAAAVASSGLGGGSPQIQ